MKLTESSPECLVRLSGVDHYLIPQAAEFLGVSERQVYRWFDDGTLTKVRYPDEGSKGICVAVAEVHEWDTKRWKEMADG